MSEFNMLLHCGLGDIITSWAVLENIKQNYDKIYVDARLDLIESWRPGCVDHYNFTIELINFLFADDPKYTLFEKKSTNNCHELIRDSAVRLIIPKCSKMLGIEHPNKPNQPYIVITTKVREVAYPKYLEFRDIFLAILKHLSTKYKIVLIGEKNIENTMENQILSTSIYSLYNDLKDIGNVLDLTEDTIYSKQNPPSLEKIRKDCDLMNKANCVVTMGCGGNMTLALTSANKLVGFRWDCYDRFDYTGLDPNISLGFNVNEFLEQLRRL